MFTFWNFTILMLILFFNIFISCIFILTDSFVCILVLNLILNLFLVLYYFFFNIFTKYFNCYKQALIFLFNLFFLTKFSPVFCTETSSSHSKIFEEQTTDFIVQFMEEQEIWYKDHYFDLRVFVFFSLINFIFFFVFISLVAHHYKKQKLYNIFIKIAGFLLCVFLFDTFFFVFKPVLYWEKWKEIVEFILFL